MKGTVLTRRSFIRLAAAGVAMGVVGRPGLSLAASDVQATVLAQALNVRQGPGTGYAVIDVLHSGSTATVLARDAAAGWYKVALANGGTGWVSASYVALTGDAAALPVSAAEVPAASVASRPARGVMVFQVASGSDIYIMNADGSNLRRLTTGMDPAISPDRSQVAFTRWDGTQNGISGSLWLINIDGSGERQLADGADQPKSPSWSPDGKRIIISMQQGGTLNNGWKCSVNGQMETVPAPVPGQRCIRVRANPWWGLRVVDVGTGAWEDVLADDYHSYAPTWDPVNSWHIVYHAYKGLQSLDLNNGNTWMVLEKYGYQGPAFSPDGKKLAATYKQSDHWEVHLMNADGTGLVRLTETPQSVIIAAELAEQPVRQWNNAAPAWSPDGSQIAYITDRNGPYEIWAMNADGSNQHPLAPSSVMAGLGIRYDGMDERMISWR